jgi:hypothetical protein
MSTTPGQAQNKYRLDAKKDLNMAISPFLLDSRRDQHYLSWP